MDKLKSFVYSFVIGDSIGKGGSKWNGVSNSDKYFMFIAEGGINKMDVGETYPPSINSVFFTGIMQCLKKSNVLESVKEELINIVKLADDSEFDDDKGYIRSAINRLSGSKLMYQPYDNYVSNITCSLCLGIGAIFYRDGDQEKLIEYSIEISRMVQNSVIGYVSGVIAAFFSSYAMRNIPVELWGYKILKMLESGVIMNYIKANTSDVNDINECSKGMDSYINKWERYMDLKFDNGNIVKKRSTMNLLWRSKYYSDIGIDTDSDLVCSSGDNCMIVVYDCLLDSGRKWETLVFYSMLHIGDTSSTGAIAASLYGLMFGMDDIPNINYKNIKEIEKLDKMIMNLRK